MNDLKEKERKAIEALRMFEPEDEPYYLCYDVMHWWISDVMTLQGQTTFDGFDILDV